MTRVVLQLQLTLEEELTELSELHGLALDLNKATHDFFTTLKNGGQVHDPIQNVTVNLLGVYKGENNAPSVTVPTLLLAN